MIQDSSKVYLDILNNKRSDMLEVIIVVLIALETVVMLLQIGVDSGAIGEPRDLVCSPMSEPRVPSRAQRPSLPSCTALRRSFRVHYKYGVTPPLRLLPAAASDFIKHPGQSLLRGILIPAYEAIRGRPIEPGSFLWVLKTDWDALEGEEED